MAPRRSEQGYILLMLMLFVTLLVIAAGALAPTITFEVRRDREEEMIHRGTQYSRAIQRYVKKTGRYPSRLEDLENTNNIRFLRRRYKDPVTGKDFKLLHVGEVQLASSPGIAGVSPIGGGAAPAGGAALLGAASTMLGGAATQTAPGAAAAPAASAGTNAAGDSGSDANPANPASPDSSKPDSSQSAGGIGSSQLSSTVFGGGPIVGVASISKAQTIREFNHKNHYNQWQFIYDPTMDRGGLITTPAQPALQSAVPLQQQNPSSPNSPGTQGSFGGMPGAPPVQPTQQQQQ
ncbi:MAG: hypothetical protein ACXVZH_02575 [Terriglobales bacterium]